jgi:2-succinyl-5-enolpyruvyl-6-hydroxy-3-cyclohexene-1-carboxylate synthase
LVSKRLAQALVGLPDGTLWHLHPHADRIEIVPGRVTSLTGGAMALAELNELPLPVLAPDPFLQLSERAGRALNLLFSSDARLSEPAVLREVTRLLPAHAGLFLGSSMPVRDAEMFGSVRDHSAAIAGNRGASGIDGTIASAAGFAIGLKRTSVVVLGDLAALHDLNSLAFLRQANPPLVTVIINNHGGGIFHFLPSLQLEAQVGPWWTTPHGWGFEHAARQFGLDYHRPNTLPDFLDTFSAAISAGQPCLIEVVTDREENAAIHRALLDAVRASLGPAGA